MEPVCRPPAPPFLVGCPLEEKAPVRLLISHAIVTSAPILIHQYGIPLIPDGNVFRLIFRLNLISMSLLSSGLLFAMSKQVRDNKPWLGKGKLCSASTTITPANTTTTAIHSVTYYPSALMTRSYIRTGKV